MGSWVVSIPPKGCWKHSGKLWCAYDGVGSFSPRDLLSSPHGSCKAQIVESVTTTVIPHPRGLRSGIA
jgi:hypothetical protein